MKPIHKIAFLISLAALITYFFTSPGETHYNYFSLLADAFANGKIYVSVENASHLNELIPIGNSNYYVPYAPMPAILLLIPTIFSNGLFPQTLATIILASVIVFLSVLICFELTKDKKISISIGLITAFGSSLWYMASIGSSWYLGQIVGLLFLSAAVYSKLKNKNVFLIGLFLGLAYLSRPHMILSLPFFIKYSKKDFVKNLLLLGFGIAPLVLFNTWYNFARFGVVFDKGYALIPGVLEEEWYQKGIFHFSYIPRHIKAIFLELPHFQNKYPFIVPELRGMALWLTSPILLVIIKTKINNLTKLSILALSLVGLPIIMHGTYGFTQFGYRFSLDIWPFLLILLAYSLKNLKLKKFVILLLFVSIMINLWGVFLINKLGIFVF